MTDAAPVSEAAAAPTISEPFDQKLRTGTWREPSTEGADIYPVLTFPWGDVVVTETLFVGRDRGYSPLADRLEQDGFGWVGRKHAEIYLEDGKLYVRDLNSMNHTYVNGVPIETRPVALSNGDQVAFSRHLVATVRLS